jgi:hypothetical protein
MRRGEERGRIRGPVVVAIALVMSLLIAGGAQAAGPYAAGSIIPFTDPANGELSALGTTAAGAIVQFARNAQGTWTSSDITVAGAVSGTAVPYTDPQGGGLIAFAQSPSGDFIQFARSSSTGAWVGYDMSSLYNLGQVAGPVLPYTDPQGGGLIAFAQSPSGDFIQFARNSSTGAWVGYDMSSLYNLGKVAGPVVPYTDPESGQLLAFARSPSGDLMEFARNSSTGAWTRYDITDLFGVGSVSGTVMPYTDPASGQLLAFARFSSGDLMESGRNSSTGAWTAYDITDLFGVGSVGGTVVPYIDPATHQLLVFATDPSGDALELSRDAQGAWAAQPIPTPPPVQPVAVSQPLPVPVVPKHGGERALRVRFVLDWTWDHARTRLRAVRVIGVPRGARIEVRCRGRGCPRGAVTAGYRRLVRFRRALDGRVFRAGDIVTITVSAPERSRERIAVEIRDGKEPKARLV